MDDFDDELDDDYVEYQEVLLIPYVEMLKAIPDELYPENHRQQLMIRVMLRRVEEKLYPGQYPKNWATLVEVIDC